ncbi:unnamed protein product [Prunus brigantina]
MSDSESAFDFEPNAFDGKSSDDQRGSSSLQVSFESAESEDAEVEVIGEKIRAPPSFGKGKVLQRREAVPLDVVPCDGACTSTGEHCEFLMGDTRLPDQHASYYSETSTSGRGDLPAESTSLPGVTVVSPGNPRVPLGQPRRHLFGVDYLGMNLVTEAKLAKYWAEYHILESVRWRIPGPRESLSHPKDGEVVFFTDVLR